MQHNIGFILKVETNKVMLSKIFFILLATFILSVAGNIDPCRSYSKCASCTSAGLLGRDDSTKESRETNDIHPYSYDILKERLLQQSPRHSLPCLWYPKDEMCTSYNTSSQDLQNVIIFQDECPLSPTPYPTENTSLYILSDWMDYLLHNTDGQLSQLTLWDLCLPGTHDSISYDLSLTVSDGGLDEFETLSAILHNASLPGGRLSKARELEDFFRMQAKTQQLDVRQQLDNGVRFLDFRIMMESDSKDWFNLHFLQSKQLATFYLTEIKSWLDKHPNEIVVLFLSKHGDTNFTGYYQYPNVTSSQKDLFWKSYISIFEGLLIDTRVSMINETTIDQLLKNNHRLVTYASDYEDFTSSSPYALDARSIDNYYRLDGLFHRKQNFLAHQRYFRKMKRTRKKRKEKGTFSLMSMNTAGPYWQVSDAALVRFFQDEKAAKRCAAQFRIDGMNEWCPSSLLGISQLTTYYNQWSLEMAFRDDGRFTSFPNAFYLDALDYNGTLRTGNELLFGGDDDGKGDIGKTSDVKSARYAYVHTILMHNVAVACLGKDGEGQCKDTKRVLEEQRGMFPMRLWDDFYYGRRSDWP